ncbi:hypothetical protein KDW_28490 [Dictyobacter vulcani]|uniref:Major facilitator superfamily (MFS) profile domain-containing protein n=1 Tax=Dictyobacter vulcani TaxID=2607529 RepID=A0A5J4KQN5_9CHLR|nr:hypothetical protein KDW_28490 [Dictyobacter vulcani]
MTSRTKGFWILLATILGSSMAFIDGSVVNVAMPRIQLELNASAASVQWVVEAYALFLGALILVGGSMGDLFGRKRMFALGIVIFAAASVWCGLTSDITQLVVARAVQGIGGALLTPESLAILRASFDEGQRGKAIGMWSAFSAITSALGPVLGAGWCNMLRGAGSSLLIFRLRSLCWWCSISLCRRAVASRLIATWISRVPSWPPLDWACWCLD